MIPREVLTLVLHPCTDRDQYDDHHLNTLSTEMYAAGLCMNSSLVSQIHAMVDQLDAVVSRKTFVKSHKTRYESPPPSRTAICAVSLTSHTGSFGAKTSESGPSHRCGLVGCLTSMESNLSRVGALLV
eukprot:scaffold10501_cov141-Amphora_coffeaeformis.AAC.1